MTEIIAETDRLWLRTWDADDEWRFYNVMNRPAVMRWLGGVQSREQWHAAYQRLLSYQFELGFTFWVLERKSDSALIGFCGLKRSNAPGADLIAGNVEIGWRLREDEWGQGYAKEAAIASLDLAFDRFRAPTVVGVTAAGNLASQGLMKRLGMSRREKLDFIDRRFPTESEVNPQIVFSIASSQWPRARSAVYQ